MADSQGQSSSSAQPQQTGESSQNQPTTADTKAEQTVQKCGNCGKEDSEETPLKPCLMCKSVSYCSRDCKKAQTKQHKKVCAAAAQEYAKTAEYKPASRALPKDSHRGGLQKWQFDT